MSALDELNEINMSGNVCSRNELNRLARCLKEVTSAVYNRYRKNPTKNAITLFEYMKDELQFKLEVNPDLYGSGYSCRFELHLVSGSNYMRSTISINNDTSEVQYGDIIDGLKAFGLSDNDLCKITDTLTSGFDKYYIKYLNLYDGMSS